MATPSRLARSALLAQQAVRLRALATELNDARDVDISIRRRAVAAIHELIRETENKAGAALVMEVRAAADAESNPSAASGASGAGGAGGAGAADNACTGRDPSNP